MLHSAMRAHHCSPLRRLPRERRPPPSRHPGGAFSSPMPVVSSVQCQRSCAGVSLATAGSVVVLRGRELARSSTSSSSARPARRRRPREAGEGLREARCRAGAPRRGHRAAHGPHRRRRGLEAQRRGGAGRPALKARAGSGSGAPQLDAEVATPKVFFDDGHPALLSVLVKDSGDAAVSADLIRLSDGAAVAHWDLGPVAPGAVSSIEWDGTAGARVQARGAMRSRSPPPALGGAGTTTAARVAGVRKAGTRPAGFLFLPNMFPIQGAHEYGEGEGRFGAQRDGHSHGPGRLRRLRHAAGRRARRHRALEGPPGARRQLSGDRRREDGRRLRLHALLRDPPWWTRATACSPARIGFVGDTGDADGCHLHFEMWSAPGGTAAAARSTPPLADVLGQDELVDVVDDDDRVIGRATRARSASATCCTGRLRGRALLARRGARSRRAETKDLWPGYWDIAVGGVVDAGEDYATAARRELAEELGIEAALAEVGSGRFDGARSRT